jgi:hypothetical protein
MEKESNLALTVKKENNISKLHQMKMIARKHNQEKESKRNWGNYIYKKMKAKKIKSEKK